MIDRERAERLITARRSKASRTSLGDGFTAEWFQAQREFYEDPARLVAAICSRRAGKTRGGNRHFVRQAMGTPYGRFLYLNSTRHEARKLAWVGARGDGMKSLVERYKLNAVCNESDLSIHFPEIDSWIYVMGADDEAGVSRALGLPYHEVWWDEFQKVPAKLAPTIRDVLMPTLLDYRGRLRATGTPVRNMAGMFYEITQPQVSKRTRGWSVHHWSLLDNPFFGRAEKRNGKWFVLAGMGDIVSGPHEESELEAAIAGARFTRGMLDLQELLGGPEVAPLDSPTMRREGKGEWVHEDANHVYWVHKVSRDKLCYAPPRVRQDGFPDIKAAMADLPGWPERDYMLAFGNDLGTRDPYAFCLWAWSGADPVLYEVASYSKSGLDYDEMGARMRAVSEVVRIGLTVADAGGGGKPAVMGWSKTWQDRYHLPIVEAEKHNKYQAIQMFNTDMVNGRMKLRDGGPFMEEMLTHQWSSIVSSTGKMVEDPTTANHVCLVAGTMVESESGPAPIEELQAGDMVWTRQGLKQVTAAWCTGTRPTWRLEHDAGSLTGTAEHPVWTQRGWVELCNLTPDDTLSGWENTDPQSQQPSAEEPTSAIRKAKAHGCGGTSLAAEDSSCTARSGRLYAAPFHPSITSTTRTETALTIESAISSASTAAFTSVSTCGRLNASSSPGESCVTSPSQPLPYGTPLPREGHGIPSMPVRLQPLRSLSPGRAQSAEENSRQSARATCAATSASPGNAAIAESTTSIRSARSAGKPSAGTGTLAAFTAPRNVASVTPTGERQPVFNLTVADAHEYFANGILVSNCDAALYAHRHSYHHRYREPEKKPLPGTPEWMLREERELLDVATSDYDG